MQLQIYTHKTNIHRYPIQLPIITCSVCVCWCLPDDLDQLAHVDVVRYQELGLVQNGQLLLSLVSLNDHLQQPHDTTGRKSDVCCRLCGHRVRLGDNRVINSIDITLAFHDLSDVTGKEVPGTDLWEQQCKQTMVVWYWLSCSEKPKKFIKEWRWPVQGGRSTYTILVIV